MEVIAFIMMIVLVLISASDKKRKAAKRAGDPEATVRPQGSAQAVARPQAVAQPQAAARPQVAVRPQAVARPQTGGTPVGQMSPAEREARLHELRQKRAERTMEAAGRAPGIAMDSSLTELKTLLTVNAQPVSAEGESLLADEDCRGGSMPHTHAEGQSTLADEECVGGSMAHSHTEGSSRAEQRQRLSELDRRRAAEEDDSLVPGAIDARALRRAVVMAEVLGKPKGLRKSRYVA